MLGVKPFLKNVQQLVDSLSRTRAQHPTVARTSSDIKGIMTMACVGNNASTKLTSLSYRITLCQAQISLARKIRFGDEDMVLGSTLESSLAPRWRLYYCPGLREAIQPKR